MNKKIYKIQRSLYHKSKVLVYDKEREFFGELPITPDIELILGIEYKIYVRGYVDENGKLNIIRKTKPQTW